MANGEDQQDQLNQTVQDQLPSGIPPQLVPQQQPRFDPRNLQALQLQNQIQQLLNPQPRPWWQSALQGLALSGGARTPEQATQNVQQQQMMQAQQMQQAIQQRVAMLNQIRQQQNLEREQQQGQQRIDLEARRVATEEATSKARQQELEQVPLLGTDGKPMQHPDGTPVTVSKKVADTLQRQLVLSTPKGKEELEFADWIKRRGTDPSLQTYASDRTGFDEWQEDMKAGRKTSAVPKVNYNNGIPVSVTKGKDEFVIGDPAMPPDLQKIGDAAIASHKQRLKEESDLAMQRDAAASKRAEDAADRRERIQQSAAPQQVKLGVDKAYQSKDLIDEVRKIVTAKPGLAGPAVGRLEQVTQGIGTTFGQQNPEDERDAATLAADLGNLLITELQVASPGRTSVQLLPEIRSFSAQMKSDPKQLEGFLKGTETRANIAIKGGKRWGIDLEKNTNQSGGGTTGGNAGKKGVFNPATGQVEFK